jgi:uncharacterized protein (DUF1697 family)
MSTRIAFLRAINLGAKRKFPRDDVVAAVEGAGFTGVLTHLNTGNVRLETSMRSTARIEAALEAAFLADRGFEVPTLVLTPDELREVDAAATAIEHDGHHYVALLRERPAREALAALQARAGEGERVVLGGRAVHLLVGADGVHGTRLGNNLVEKVLGTVATTRNPTVLRTLVERWC